MRMQHPASVAVLLAAFALVPVNYPVAASLPGLQEAPGPILFKSPA